MVDSDGSVFGSLDMVGAAHQGRGGRVGRPLGPLSRASGYQTEEATAPHLGLPLYVVNVPVGVPLTGVWIGVSMNVGVRLFDDSC